MGTGTDVAIEASDLTLVRGDLRAAVDAIRLSRRTLATIKGNLFWAFAYNVWRPSRWPSWACSPAHRGSGVAFSSVFVVTNSLRLRRFRAVSLEGRRRRAPLPGSRGRHPSARSHEPAMPQCPRYSVNLERQPPSLTRRRPA
jgi:Cu+-exporting ATPase